jgi:hypothetical protein
MVHDTSRSGLQRDASGMNEFPLKGLTGHMVNGRRGATYQDDDSERTGRHQPVNPVLDLVQRHVEAGGHDAALVDATVELDHDLAGTVVVDVFKLINVA